MIALSIKQGALRSARLVVIQDFHLQDLLLVHSAVNQARGAAPSKIGSELDIPICKSVQDLLLVYSTVNQARGAAPSRIDSEFEIPYPVYCKRT